MEKRSKGQKKQCKIDYEKLIEKLTKDGRLAKSSRVMERFEEKLNKFRKLKEADRYVLLCFAGMERLTVKDVRRCLGDRCLMVFHFPIRECYARSCGCGKSLVTEPDVIGLFAPVAETFNFYGIAGYPKGGRSDVFKIGDDKEFNYVSGILIAGMQKKLRYSSRQRRDVDFQASVIRRPRKHSLRSKDIACLVGDVFEEFSTWSVNLRRTMLRLRCWCMTESCDRNVRF